MTNTRTVFKYEHMNHTHQGASEDKIKKKKKDIKQGKVSSYKSKLKRSFSSPAHTEEYPKFQT